MPSEKHIVVVGSINMDLVVRTPRIPAAGETLLGDSLVTLPGGKGANQAVAAARLAREGLTVHMVGRVGNDDFGQRLINCLGNHHVKTAHVIVTEGASSGAAVILVDKQGENTIVVASGANALVSPPDVDAAQALIASASAVIVQLEIPLATVAHVIALCQRHGVFVILDPAPVPPDGLPRELYGVDIFTPNRLEAEALLGLEVERDTSRKRAEDPKQLATRLLSRGARSVVLKRGKNGAILVDRDEIMRTIDPIKVNVVDTTAAGDAFTAALAVGHAEGLDPLAAARLANAAGAACCRNFGAQPALPTRDEVESLMELA